MRKASQTVVQQAEMLSESWGRGYECKERHGEPGELYEPEGVAKSTPELI
jgi:hypothetical protein